MLDGRKTNIPSVDKLEYRIHKPSNERRSAVLQLRKGGGMEEKFDKAKNEKESLDNTPQTHSLH